MKHESQWANALSSSLQADSCPTNAAEVGSNPIYRAVGYKYSRFRTQPYEGFDFDQVCHYIDL